MGYSQGPTHQHPRPHQDRVPTAGRAEGHGTAHAGANEAPPPATQHVSGPVPTSRERVQDPTPTAAPAGAPPRGGTEEGPPPPTSHVTGSSWLPGCPHTPHPTPPQPLVRSRTVREGARFDPPPHRFASGARATNHRLRAPPPEPKKSNPLRRTHLRPCALNFATTYARARRSASPPSLAH